MFDVDGFREEIIIGRGQGLGKWGEDRATAYLQEQGWEIVDRNLDTPPGECDILARDGDTLVFVEVKTRSAGAQASAAEAVTYQKRQKIRRMARWVISRYHQPPVCRFDVIAITCNRLKADINHIEGAFGIQE